MRLLFAACLLVAAGCAEEATGERDPTLDQQSSIRIISLAPHLTELVYAAGAGDTLVGVVEFSDYPEAAKALPRIGDAFRVDIERIIALKPDLVLAWSSGNPQQMIDQLLAQKIPVRRLEPGSLQAIAEQIEYIGQLAETSRRAQSAAEAFRHRLAHLQQTYDGRETVRVFYQIAPQPLYTINRQQIISEVIDFCGGRNIFSELNDLAPVVSPEAVVAEDPDVMLAPGFADDDPFERWRSIETMRVVRDNTMYVVDADLVGRATPRLLDGIVQICDALQAARDAR